jgi:ATP-binding cassette subfamily D (ALD) long-chain fatty acid import protein
MAARGVVKKLLKRLAMAAAGGGALWWLFLRRPARHQIEPSSGNAKKKNVGLNKEFGDQLRKVLPVLFPTFFSRTTALMFAHTSCLIARTLASIYLASMDGKIVKALITGNGRRFVSLLSIWLMSAGL